MDDLSATLEVSSSNYSMIYFVLFSGKRLTNYGIVGAYVWFKYLAKKSRVSLLLLHVFLAEIRLQN